MPVQIYSVIVLGCLPLTVLGQTDTVAPLEPLSSPYLLKLTGGLILVVVIIFGLAWMLKKLNINQASQNGLIRIVAGLSIGTRDRIVLLQVGEEQILVGLTAGRIQKLHTLAEPLAVSDETSVPSVFAEKLQQMMRHKDGS
ncbi:MAG: flagellar biosynthetic protein FliO [Pseudomonadota bacterium]